MGKIIVAIIAVLLILTGGILEQVYIYDTFHEVAELSSEISEYIKNNDIATAKQTTDKLISLWKKKRDILELTSPHNEVKDMMAYISQLKGYLESDQNDSAYAQTFVIHEDAMNKLNILAYRLKNVF